MKADARGAGSLTNWPVRLLATTPSTNDEARQAARDGEPEGWFVAERQTKGRGRQNRFWHSEPGNLYASLLLIDPAPFDRFATLPFVAGLSMYDAVARFLVDADRRLKLKWPNDLLLDGKKLNGILLESEPHRDGRTALIAGFGINSAHYPGDTERPATSLSAAGILVDPMDLHYRLDEALAANLAIWDRGQGFPAIRERWIERATGIGQTVMVRGPDRNREGRFAGLDQDGYLLLDLSSGGREKVHAGDLFFDFERRSE